MGCIFSICNDHNEKDTSLYASLVVPKPTPISLESPILGDSSSDIPIFATVEDENETLTDDEINLYASNLRDSSSS